MREEQPQTSWPRMWLVCWESLTSRSFWNTVPSTALIWPSACIDLSVGRRPCPRPIIEMAGLVQSAANRVILASATNADCARECENINRYLSTYVVQTKNELRLHHRKIRSARLMLMEG